MLDTAQNRLLLKAISKIVKSYPNPWWDRFMVAKFDDSIVVVIDHYEYRFLQRRLEKRVENYVNRRVKVATYQYEISYITPVLALTDTIKIPGETIAYIQNLKEDFIEV